MKIFFGIAKDAKVPRASKCRFFAIFWEMWEKTDALCSIFAFTYVEVLAMDQ